MNRQFIFLLLVVVFANQTVAFAQPGGKTGSTYLSARDTSVILDIREKLVQLALQNPGFEIADRKITVAEFQLKKAKGDWLAAINANINLNEITINPSANNQLFFPLWNVGVSVPLNYFSQNRYLNKIAKENVYIANAEKNEKYRMIRTKILTRYEDYLMYKEMLELQNRATQDAYLTYRQKETDFKDDTITFDEYNKAFAVYKEQQDKRLKSQRDFNVSKLDIEEMIGISMDELLQQYQK